MTSRQGRRRKQLLDDFKEKRRYWKLKGQAPDRTVWRTGFGRDCGPVQWLWKGLWTNPVALEGTVDQSSGFGRDCGPVQWL